MNNLCQSSTTFRPKERKKIDRRASGTGGPDEVAQCGDEKRSPAGCGAGSRVGRRRGLCTIRGSFFLDEPTTGFRSGISCGRLGNVGKHQGTPSTYDIDYDAYTWNEADRVVRSHCHRRSRQACWPLRFSHGFERPAVPGSNVIEAQV